MSSDPQPTPPVTVDRGRGATSAEGGSRVRSVATGSQSRTAPQRRGRSILFALAVIVLTVGLAGVWTVLARRELAAARVVPPPTAELDLAHKGFATLRVRSQATLEAHCRVMAEDPRLKSTLNTEGIDSATVADILADLGKLRRSGFLMVLTPEGRVFAEAGAKELQGLDLSSSSIVKKAQAGKDAVVGAWVLGGKVMDLSVMGLSFADRVIGYLVVGEQVDEKLLKDVAAQSGVEVASALGDKVVLASSSDAGVQKAFAAALAHASGQHHVIAVDDKSFATAAVDLNETAQSHRLLLVRPVVAASTAAGPLEKLEWMLFVPPALVLLAVLFALSGNRSRRIS